MIGPDNAPVFLPETLAKQAPHLYAHRRSHPGVEMPALQADEPMAPLLRVGWKRAAMRALPSFLLFVAPVLPVAAADVYEGYTGRWVEAVATAYSPHDAVDGAYHATKGDRWRYITADAKTDVRQVPYGVAVPNRDGRPVLPYGTKVIIPAGQGYLDGSRPIERVFNVDDTGSGISKAARASGKLHVDLRYMHSEWALKWPTKTIKIFIITGLAPAKPYVFRPQDDLFWDPNWKPATPVLASTR